MKHFEPVIRKRQFEPLRPVLKSWFCVLEDYIDRVPGDLPFWYRERPQVGFFAEAAWRAGWAALEEWGMEKGSQLKPSRGRNDLWIGRGKQEWFIEAKHAWCDIQKCKENSLETRLHEALDVARKSAEHLTCKSSQKVAAAFVSPIWKPENAKVKFGDARQAWIEACDGAQADVVASFIFAERDERQVGKNGERFIGSVLLLVSVK